MFIRIVCNFTTCGRRAGQKEGSTHAILHYWRIWYGTKQHCKHKDFASETRGGKELCAKLSFLISMTSVLKSSNLKLLWLFSLSLSRLLVIFSVETNSQFAPCLATTEFHLHASNCTYYGQKGLEIQLVKSYVVLVQGLSLFMSTHGLFRLFSLIMQVPK